jgi:type I restriction enzyme S subunit
MEQVVPKLRFPEFEGNWEKKNGNLVFENISNKNHNSDLPILAITQEFGAIPRDLIDYKVSVTDKSIDSYKVVQIGDFIISLRSFQGGIEYSNYNGICSPAYIILRPYVEINNLFFKIYFKTNKYIKELQKNLEGIRDGKMISYKYFSDIKLPYPSFEEQTKIATFLSVVDDKLTALKQKKNLLEQYKKGVMQKIFSQELRFKDDNGNEYPDWEENKLGELSAITTGKLDANAMTENGEFRFYTCAKDYYKIDKYSFDTEALLISGNGANVGYIHYYKGKFNAYQRTYILDKFNENIIYIKFYLDNFLYLRINSEKKEGNTPYIVMSTLSEMQINLPHLNEQTKIANFLSTIDDKINHCQVQIEKMEVWKKGLLQKMFC